METSIGRPSAAGRSPPTVIGDAGINYKGGTQSIAVDAARLMDIGAAEEECSHVGSVEPDQSVQGIVQAIGAGGGRGEYVQGDTAQSKGDGDPFSTGWTKRVCVGKTPAERTPCPSWKSALEKSIRGYAEKLGEEVIDPCLGTTFDSLGEAYDFYNLYSWEHGFEIRYGKSRLNAEKTKCIQEIVCGCSGKPTKENTKSCRCECPAMIRLLRTTDNGWYITEHRVKHNHTMTENCGEKVFWPSHKHIDIYTRDLVRQLRENNINIGKVYSIIAAFFGNERNVPFTKRSLRNLCGKLSREQADDDVRKTVQAFDDLGAKDPDFMFRVQPDAKGRIKNLMWTTGSSRLQYKFFGDAITFDTTYKTNLYDMPFGLFRWREQTLSEHYLCWCNASGRAG